MTRLWQTHAGQSTGCPGDQPLPAQQQLAEVARILCAGEGSTKAHETVLFGDWQRSDLCEVWSPEIVQVG